jgi:alpha-1,3-rhamnosyl/mannosyltransferase
MTRLLVGLNLLYLKPGRVGGSEEYVRRMIAALDSAATGEVELRLFVNRRFGAAHPQLAGAHETVVAPISGDHPPVRIAVESTWLARETKRHRLDVVHHVANTVPHVVTRPAAVTIHDLQPIVRPQDFGRIKGAYLRRQLGAAAAKARVVIAVSEYVRGLVIERLGVDADRVVVAPAPLDRPVEPIEPAATVEADGPCFVYPAITHPHKNHVTLLRAFAPVAAARPDVTLVLTGGDGAREREVHEEIERLGLAGSVRRTGRVPRAGLDELLRSATALVFPSCHEGYGLPVAEAMALGCPVIASNATALPEVVDGAGLLVSPDDTAGWTEAMLRLIDDDGLRARLIEAGYRQVVALTPVETARRLVAAYRSAAAAG